MFVEKAFIYFYNICVFDVMALKNYVKLCANVNENANTIFYNRSNGGQNNEIRSYGKSW